MSTAGRLANGGLIERERTLGFRFDGRGLTGHPGDTLASALLANGVRPVGRSFKYHRLRGVFTAGSEEPNALVELGAGARREPNTRATTTELFEGLVARSQNRFPSLRFDLMAAAGLLSPFLAAGFYYKTFMWPPGFWERLYEPAIRRAAGLGRPSGLPDPDAYEKAFRFCDVLVVGSGAAGLSAALAAARAGARVVVAEEDFVFGGRLNAERDTVAGMPGADWAASAAAELAASDTVTLMARTTVFGHYDGNTFGAIEHVADHLAATPKFQPRQRLWRITAQRTILAGGAIERPIVFAGNDRPGVMLASAVRTYLNRFAVAPGRRVAVFTATDEGWCTALDARAAGLEVVAVVDPRRDIAPALTEGLPAYAGAEVTRARGGLALRGIEVETADGSTERFACDVLAVSGGFNPRLGLATHLNGAGRWSDRHAACVPGDLPRGMAAAGAANGTWRLDEVIAEGDRAGREAAEMLGFAARAAPLPETSGQSVGMTALWQVKAPKGKSFVDFQNDVTVADIELAVREGFASPEHLKRYTTLGMATDQGKTSNVTGLAILAELTGRTVAGLGETRARPPDVPVAIGALAGLHRGAHFRPTRLTPSHRWAEEHGAVFTEAGQWLRAQWFAKPGEYDWLETVSREVRAVRGGVGVCDVSTLGKIALDGEDAGKFLDRVYCNTFSTLPVGKVRYGLMLREDGFVMDDGTTARLGDTRYVMTTTTANAGKVMQHLEFCHQVLWPELDVCLTSTTEQWAQFAVAGPRSRDLMGALLGDAADLSDEAFPFLGAREFRWQGIATRLFGVSFSGERGYEIAVPAGYGEALVGAIMDAGRDHGVVPYGTEALGVMRIEKGHVAGPELNGQTVARDLGLGRMMSGKKDYVGRAMAERPALVAPDRPVLVGLVAADAALRFGAGAHLIDMDAVASPQTDLGHISSVAFSPSLERWIGLGFLRDGEARMGTRVRGHDPVRGRETAMEVVPTVFVDPQGVRMRG